MSDSINASFGVSESPYPLSKSIMPSPNITQYHQYLPYNNNNKPKTSPITYLIETEEEYLNDLRCLLQQETRSWDRDNPLPPELKIMFSIADEIYYYNNNFLSRLKQTGTDLISANELGNTLMAWVEEMEGPYTAYFQNYRRGVNLWPEIDNNLILQQSLNSISAQRNQPITLDFLFEVPLKRIHYYKKLYMRILKNSEPGRSDYDILAAANQRIDYLVELEKNAKESNKPREDIPIPQTVSNEFFSPILSRGDTNKSRESIPIPQTVSNGYISPVISQGDTKETIKPIESIPLPQTVSNEYISPVMSQGDTVVFDAKNPENAVNLTLSEFESQLDTSRVVDFFTKQPKTFNVQLLPPHLPFKREIILHNDFKVILPDVEGTNSHRAHLKAHLVLFTDLLLICQQLTPEEKALNPTKDFWLLYPPLSGRHLTINDMYDSKEELLKLVALERESIVIFADNKNVKEIWLKEFTQMIEFAKAASSRPQVLPTSPSPQLTISTQESPSPGNFPATDLDRTLSSPGYPRSPGRLSPPLKVGLPSSPLSNSAPLRSRSPDATIIVSPPNSDDRLQAELIIPTPRTNSVRSSNSANSINSVSSIGSFTETIYQSPPCDVSCWVVNEWIPMTKRDNCIVEIRVTSSNNPCLVVSLESNGRVILNAWIHPATLLNRESSFSISLSCEMGQVKEYYKVTMTNHMDSDELFSNLLKMKNHRNNELGVQGFVSRSSSLKNNQAQEIEQTLTNVMESKIKLFLQSDHGVWTNLGWGNMKLLLETPSHRKRIIITRSDKQKSKLVDSFVDETSVRKLNKSNVTFKINNIGASASGSIIYMMQMKDEARVTKAIEIMRRE